MLKSRTKKLLLAPVVAAGALAFASTTAFAPAAAAATGQQPSASGADWSFQAKLDPVNNSGASGSVWITGHGSTATVTEKASGLASKFMDGPFPHVSHIHVVTSGSGSCPTGMTDDKNGDGVVSTPEAAGDYGAVNTTLTTSGDTSAKSALAVKRAAIPGSSGTYKRTFQLSDKAIQAMKDGQASVVIHGLDPATLSKKAQNEKSPLSKDLPLAATAPAACGTLALSQMNKAPNGAPQTGGGSTSQGVDGELIALGGGLLVVAGGAALVARRRTATQRK
ncbi:hypothetical protein [Spelaeicoccus albus]|uniref:CHRD domain-containing protein n=1 Tax=Spelaeicoccus albus TaxID=1280376 RepID=A0A7Z0A8S8_9MICO|nr:hypothetical protein [Spelaeicoccus albus]NYI66487.1 hypothetical protein [Spelaeicoccus albus]